VSKSKRSELRDDIRYLSRRCESYFGFYYNTYDQDELTHPRDDSWVTIAAPIPFVPPVTRAFLEFRSQKLAGGGAGTLDELLDAYATEETMAAIPRMKKREIMAHKHNNASKNSPRPRKAEKRHNKTDGPPRTALDGPTGHKSGPGGGGALPIPQVVYHLLTTEVRIPTANLSLVEFPIDEGERQQR
jgi:hypothetical protein